MVKNDGLAAHGLERPHRRVHAARQQRHRLLEHLQQPELLSNRQQQLWPCSGITEGVAHLL